MITAKAAFQLSADTHIPQRESISGVLHAIEVGIRAAALVGDHATKVPVPHALVGTIGGWLEEAGYKANWETTPYYRGKGRPYRYINIDWSRVPKDVP